jgi:xylose isomerase
MPFRINGQTSPSFDASYANDPYTNQTTNHSILAYDADTRRLFFGATSSLDTRDLVRWAERQGYEDLVKFDGGASTELNVGGRAVVAGTSRRVPVWFGIGC